MEDIVEQLARRDRAMKARAKQMTYAERMEAMGRLQEQSWLLLRSSPEGYARFLRRNFKARAIDVTGVENVA